MQELQEEIDNEDDVVDTAQKPPDMQIYFVKQSGNFHE